MPPSRFFRDSRHRMQQFVRGPEVASDRAKSLDASNVHQDLLAKKQGYSHIRHHSHNQPHEQAQIRSPPHHPSSAPPQAPALVTAPLPEVESVHTSTETQQRSRQPIINAGRVATANAARIPLPKQTGPPKEASVAAHHRIPGSVTGQSTAYQQSQQHYGNHFWEGSTFDEGSNLSDTASNPEGLVNSRLKAAYQQVPYQQGSPVRSHSLSHKHNVNDISRQQKIYDPSSYGQQQSPRHHAPKREVPEDSKRRPHDTTNLPFTIDKSGFMRNVPVPGQLNGTNHGLTPDRDRHLSDILEVSPDATPTKPRASFAKLAMRDSKTHSYVERTSSTQREETFDSPQRSEYSTSKMGTRHSKSQPEALEDTPGLSFDVRRKTLDRTTIFEGIDTPVDTNPASGSEAEIESIDQRPTPKPEKRYVALGKKAVEDRTRQRPQDRDSKTRNTLQPSFLAHPSSDRKESRKSASSKKRSFEPDYDDSVLAAMSYEDLKNQAFDYDPAMAEAAQTVSRPVSGSLPEKLEHYLRQDKAQQTKFFTEMPINEWDDAGDWFLGQFSDLMGNFKKARQERRGLQQQFEYEISERQAAVQTKAQGVEQTLVDLKSEGEGMMRGKEID